MQEDQEEFDDDWERPPSKSQLKRDAHKLQELGESLIALNKAQFEGIDMPDNLRSAVEAARSMRQRGAHKRQLQLIGKIMRNIDAESIAEAVAKLGAGHAENVRQHHYLETLTASLIENDGGALKTFLDENPSAQSQHLRQLMRNAVKEAQADKPPKSRRLLFRYLRDTIANRADTNNS